MAEQQREPISQFIGIYMGKMARRNYQTKKGDKGIVYGVMVKKSENDQYAKSFTAYTSTKGLDSIRELDWVKIGYVTQSFVRNDGQQGTSNKILWIGKTDERQVQQQPSQQVSSKLDISQFETFKAKYFEVCKANNIVPTITQLIGFIIANYDKERNAELIAKCKEAIK